MFNIYFTDRWEILTGHAYFISSLLWVKSLYSWTSLVKTPSFISHEEITNERKIWRNNEMCMHHESEGGHRWWTSWEWSTFFDQGFHCKTKPSYQIVCSLFTHVITNWKSFLLQSTMWLALSPIRWQQILVLPCRMWIHILSSSF